MTKKLTQKQKNAYQFIISFTEVHGYSPTIREIQAFMKYRSPSTAFSIVKSLEKAGCIKTIAKCPRTIQIVGGVNRERIC